MSFTCFGSLIALEKSLHAGMDPCAEKDLRPIVSGNIFKRIISKAAVAHITSEIVMHLQPLQFGVGIKGGCEAIIHACNNIIRQANLPNDFVMASVDFENAFNRVNRQKMFDFVRKHFPSISNYVERTYGISSELLYGEFIVSASSGVQQGDPLSPALFCLILQPLLEVIAAISDIKVFAYLDDTYIFGPLAQGESALSYLDIEGPASGLILSSKTRLWSPVHPLDPPTTSSKWHFKRELGVKVLGGAVSRDPYFI